MFRLVFRGCRGRGAAVRGSGFQRFPFVKRGASDGNGGPGGIDGMPGFIANQVLRPVNEGDPYVVLTTWESRPQFLAWVRSEEFQKGHAQSGTLPKDAYFQPNVLEMHEMIQDSTRPTMVPEPHGGPFKMH